jgi:hypothetical protein
MKKSDIAIIVSVTLVLALYVAITIYFFAKVIEYQVQETAPTTYETGLYVESENIQDTISGKALQ